MEVAGAVGAGAITEKGVGVLGQGISVPGAAGKLPPFGGVNMGEASGAGGQGAGPLLRKGCGCGCV